MANLFYALSIRSFGLLCAVGMTGFCQLHAYAADDSLLNLDGQASAKSYVHAKNALDAYTLTSGSLPDVLGGSGVNYDVDATVLGRFGTADKDTLMLSVGGQTVDADIQHGFAPDWLSNGAMVHVIIHDAPAPAPADASLTVTVTASSSTLGNSNSECTILAAAPDSELDALAIANQPSRYDKPLTSRSADYRTYYTGPAPIYDATTRTVSYQPKSNLPAGHPVHGLTQAEAAVYPYYRAQIWRINPKLTESTLDKITTSLLVYSNYYHLDPRLVMAMIIAESSFDPNSTSNTGAMGLGQLMPGTAAGLISDPYDPIQNVGGAIKILSDNVAMYGGADQNGLVPMNTLLLTMAAYNAGNGAVKKYHGIPPYRETQVYVRRVAKYYQQLCGG